MSSNKNEPQEDTPAPRRADSISQSTSTEGGNHISNHDDDDQYSCTSSERQEREDAKEAPGVDMRVAPVEHAGRPMVFFFVICSFISFVFMLTASTTIPWLKASNGDSWTLWKNSDGQRWTSNPCDHKKQMFQAMQAFTITGCVLSLGCLVSGILQLVGRGHLGFSIAISFFTMATELTAWSLIANQYHRYNCPGETPYVNGINRLQAGFCLTFISFSFMLFSCCSLAYYLGSHFSFIPEDKERMSSKGLLAFFIIAGCSVITFVGPAFTMWEDYGLAHKIKVTLWHVQIVHYETGLSEVTSHKDYGCKDLNTMFKVGQAFAIIGAAFTFLAATFAAGAVFNRMCKWVCFGLTIASWVFLLICWAVMVSVRYRTFCKNGAVDARPYGLAAVPLGRGEQRVSFTGFVITEGLGMIISAWCVLSLMIAYIPLKV